MDLTNFHLHHHLNLRKMKYKKIFITVRGFIDPHWWNNRPRRLMATIKNNSFVYNQHTLDLVDEKLPDGTEVIADLQSFYVYEEEAYKMWQKHHEAEIAHKETVRNFEKALARLQAERFNARIGKSFSWVPAIKQVISGLSAHSNGDGRRRNTVVHMMVSNKWLTRGKFKRKRGDFLCKPRSGKFKGSMPEEFGYDDLGEKYPAKITCQECLSRARKLDRARWPGAQDLEAE